MSIERYLREFADARRATIVGPMPAAKAAIRAAEPPLIWVDGGVNHRNADSPHRGIAVGDGDSAAGDLDHALNPRKDYSDLAFVLQKLLHCAPAICDITLLGFLGGRRDHELFNLGESHHYLTAAQSPARIRFDNAICAYSKGEWTLSLNGIFSVLVFAAANITLTGACQYPIASAREIKPVQSVGLSNVGFGKITLRADAPVFILQAESETPLTAARDR